MYPSIKTRISGLCERVSPALVVPQFGLSRGNMAMPTAIGFTKKLPLDFAYVFLWCVIGFSCLMLKWFIGFSYNTSLFVVWYGFSYHYLLTSWSFGCWKQKIFPNKNKGERVPFHFKGTETISVNCQLFWGGPGYGNDKKKQMGRTLICRLPLWLGLGFIAHVGSWSSSDFNLYHNCIYIYHT